MQAWWRIWRPRQRATIERVRIMGLGLVEDVGVDGGDGVAVLFGPGVSEGGEGFVFLFGLGVGDEVDGLLGFDVEELEVEGGEGGGADVAG